MKFSLQQVADITGCRLEGDPHYLVSGVADLESATKEDASFLANERYSGAMHKSQAGVIFVNGDVERGAQRRWLVSDDPSRAFQQLLELFNPHANMLTGFCGIHATAVIHPTAQVGEDVVVGPHAVIDEGSVIGARTRVGAGSYIGPHVTVGADSLLHPRVTIRERCRIGNRVVLQPGAVIGSCGFGYTVNDRGEHVKLNQVGIVEIADDVEIGANTTVDRGRFKATYIGRGSKIDNLVQIGHGVVIGEHCVVVAQTGIAGSTTLGNRVVLAGQVAVNGHIKLDDGVRVSGKSGVSKSLPTGDYGGIPAVPIIEYNRRSVYLRNIEKLVKQIDALQKQAQHANK